MTSIVRTVARSSALRAAAIGSYRAFARSVLFLPPPRVVANGIPKAGTHLLVTLLKLLPRMMFSGTHHALNDFSISVGIPPHQLPDIDVGRLDKRLRAINKGQFMSAHFPRHPELPPLLERLGYRSVLILRDPRDIVVSHTFYVTRLTRHFLHERYNTLYKTTEERLLASITGFGDAGPGPAQESIGQRVDKYAGWLRDPDVYVCRFEALVGPRGGGTLDEQRREIAGIAAHVGRSLDEPRLRRVAERVWSTRTPTFRAGRAGDWRNHFTDEHKAAFKEVAGRQLIDLGYETSMEW